MGDFDVFRPHSIQPLAPVVAIVDVQKCVSVQIGGSVQRLVLFKELRTAHGKKLLQAETRNMQSRELPITMADGQVNILARNRHDGAKHLFADRCRDELRRSG